MSKIPTNYSEVMSFIDENFEMLIADIYEKEAPVEELTFEEFLSKKENRKVIDFSAFIDAFKDSNVFRGYNV